MQEEISLLFLYYQRNSASEIDPFQVVMYIWYKYTSENGTDSLAFLRRGGTMKIISVIEDDAAIKKILLHLDLWLTQNHDPPSVAVCCVPFPSQSYRSYEWWEALNSNTGSDYSDNPYAQSPYEDEYSQAEPWEY